jgi:sigma-B regulation protein RsbU (phosphoserine phosphatase)
VNAITLLFLIGITLIAGLVIGIVIARFRHRPGSSTVGRIGNGHVLSPAHTLHEGKDEALALANFVLYLGEQSDQRTLFRHSAEWLCAQGEAQFVMIYPYDPAAHELVNPVSIGRNADDLPQRCRMGVGVLGEVASSRQSYFIDRVSREPRFSQTVSGMETAYLVPMISGATLLGVVVMQSAYSDSFPIERRPNLDRYVSVIALETLVARRFTESKEAIARFGHFQALSQGLAEQLSTTDLIQLIVSAAREMLGTQMSILLEIRDDDDRLYPIAWSGISDKTAQVLDSRLKEDLKGLVAWARKPARTPDLRTDQRTARASQAVVAGMVSELAVPVMYLDKLYGTLAVETNIYRDFSDEEMNLLMALAAQAGIALRNAQLFTDVQLANGQLEKALVDLKESQAEIDRVHAAEIQAYETELETAREIQTSLLPQEAPAIPQVSLAARNIPARHVSGDFYQYLVMPNGKLGVAVGDVSGKGMPAALLMAVTTTALRDEVVRTTSAAGVLNELNNRLLARMKQTNMNSAMIMSVFDPATGSLDIANAGMVQPYLRNGHGWKALEIGGYPLGASGRSNYKATLQTMTPGMTLLIVSDGVIEAQDMTGTLFSFERFEALISEFSIDMRPEQIVETILKAVYDYIGDEEQQDDITVVALQIMPVAVMA